MWTLPSLCHYAPLFGCDIRHFTDVFLIWFWFDLNDCKNVSQKSTAYYKLYFIIVNTLLFSSTAKWTCLLIVPLSSVIHCRCFIVMSGQCLLGSSAIVVIPYLFSCWNIFVTNLSSLWQHFANSVRLFLFSVNKLWHHIDVILKLSVRNLDDRLNLILTSRIKK